MQLLYVERICQGTGAAPVIKALCAQALNPVLAPQVEMLPMEALFDVPFFEAAARGAGLPMDDRFDLYQFPRTSLREVFKGLGDQRVQQGRHGAASQGARHGRRISPSPAVPIPENS
jgi:hypothetical protein